MASTFKVYTIVEYSDINTREVVFGKLFDEGSFKTFAAAERFIQKNMDLDYMEENFDGTGWMSHDPDHRTKLDGSWYFECIYIDIVKIA